MDTTTRVQVEGKALEIERSFGRIEMDNLLKEVSEGNSESTWWGILCAKARSEAARAKTRIDVVKAEVAKKKRLFFESNLKSYTVDVIKDEVTADPNVQAAIEAHIVAEEKAGILEAAKDGSAGKARTLEKLSVLVGQEFSATHPRPAPELPPATRRRSAAKEAPVTKAPVL